MIDTRDEIRRFVVEQFLFGQEDELQDDASFLEQGIIDSTGVLELVSHLQERYQIAIKDEELIPDNLDSINAVVAFVARKTTSEGPSEDLRAVF